MINSLKNFIKLKTVINVNNRRKFLAFWFLKLIKYSFDGVLPQKLLNQKLQNLFLPGARPE